MWNVFDEEDYRAAFFVCVISAPICILATILRFAATKRSNRKIGLEDWFALAALVPYLTYTVMVLWIIISMRGKSVFQAGTLPPATVLAIYKVGYVMNTMYPMNQNFAKLSLLALYYRLFSVNRAFVKWIWAIGIIQMCWFMAMFWIRWFMCTPVAKVWEPTLPGHCIDSNVLLVAGEAVNSPIDFVMVALAVYMVRSLKVSHAARWKLSILFALGGLSGLIGFIKIGEAYGDVGSNILNAVWDEVQMAVSIICCCAPIWRTVIPEIPLLQTFWSKTFGSSSGRSSEKPNSGRLRGSLRTWGQGSSRKRRDPDASLMDTNVSKAWDGQEDWVPLGSGSGEVHVGTAHGQQASEEHYAYPAQGVHVHRTVEVVR